MDPLPLPTTWPSQRPIGLCASTRLRVWTLWDAGDILSVHLNEHDAREARAAYLHDLNTWCPEDRDLIDHATVIVPGTLTLG